MNTFKKPMLVGALCATLVVIGITTLPSAASQNAKPGPPTGNPKTPVAVILDEGSREIVSRRVRVEFGNGTGSCNLEDVIDVPKGRRLVIEHISSRGAIPDPSLLTSISLFHLPGPGEEEVVVHAPAIQTGQTVVTERLFNFYVVSQPMHVYSDAPVMVCADALTRSDWFVEVLVSGYLVDRS